MTTRTQLRKAALALPEVEEGTHFGLPAYKVRGRGFASIGKSGATQLRMTSEEAARTLERLPSARPVSRAGKLIGVSVALTDIDGMVLNDLVRRSWLSVAPKALVHAYRAATEGEAPSGPDALPRSIGNPATRALLSAGVRSLPEVAALSRRDLLALHGVGPKGVRLLIEALAERGMQLREG